METNTKKKIGLLGCIGTGIGAIIGSGIFGSLPTVINDIGTGIVLALLATIVYTLAKTIPNVYLSSVAPASGSFFIAPTKLIHPAVGVFMAAQNLLQPVLISVFAVLFGDYFVALFPALEGYKTLISIVILPIYTGIAWQGNHTFAFVNNIMVVVLMVAMGCYIFVGMPSIDTSRLTLGEIFNPGVKLTSFAAAVGVLASSLSGGSAVSQIADDVKNPNRNIPLALLLSPTIVAFIYIGMGVVTIGCMPAGELTTLSEVGKTFLPSGLLTFFIVGGPLFGVLTSMVPVIMLTCAQIQAAADNDLFPAFVGKKNKNGVSPVILCFVMLFSILPCSNRIQLWSVDDGIFFRQCTVGYRSLSGTVLPEKEISACLQSFYLQDGYRSGICTVSLCVCSRSLSGICDDQYTGNDRMADDPWCSGTVCDLYSDPYLLPEKTWTGSDRRIKTAL